MCKTRFVLVMAALLLGASVGQAPAADDPYLVGWWTFDEGSGTAAKDSSGHGHDGTLNGDPKWVGGPLGGALDFDGTNDFVEIPDDPGLSITGAITIAAWTNMRTTSSGEMAILSKGGWATNDLPYELTEERGGVIFWQFYNDAGRDSNSPSAGEWHHIAATYDGKVFKCYIDGVLAQEWAYAGAMPKNTASVTIGRRSRGGTFFNGMIDDVRLYDRALTAGQINVVLAGGAPVYGKAENPSPADGALAVTMPLLQWGAGENALFHSVYMGTSPELTEANLVSSRQILTMLYYVQGLQPGGTYYWRVDEIEKDGVTVHTGDVWSFVAQALTAYYPNPADGAVDTAPAPMLTWLPGQAVIKHHVYFGDSENAVQQGSADVDKGEVTDPSFTPGALENLRTYYWRVDETVAGGAVKTGPVWSFTTCQPVDDFESYTDQADEEIFSTWIDGFTDGTNGSTVGYMTATNGTFGETTIVHSGQQSMPLDYNNVSAPFYSEAYREFAPTQDWTAGSVTTLILWARGKFGNASAQLYVAVEDASKKVGVVAYPEATLASTTAWTQWKIPLSSFAGVNLAKVKKLYIGLGDRNAPAAGGSGRMFIDDIMVTK
jgi:hypothetical protein